MHFYYHIRHLQHWTLFIPCQLLFRWVLSIPLESAFHASRKCLIIIVCSIGSAIIPSVSSSLEQNMAFERHCICHFIDSIRKMNPSNLSNIIYVRPFTATDASVPWVFIIKLLVRTIIGENLTTPTGCSATLSSVIITVFGLVSMESFGIKWNVNVLRQSCGHSMWGSGFYLSNPVDDSMIHKQHFTFPIDFEFSGSITCCYVVLWYPMIRLSKPVISDETFESPASKRMCRMKT